MIHILGLFLFLSATGISSQRPNKPNFVIVVADDLGWDDVGFHGSPEVKTPNIDKLAAEGVILNNFYVQPICTPTRSALLTGRYPIRNGMQSSVIMTSQAWGLGLEEKLLPEQLRDLGYRTHLVGKWHLGFFSPPYLPLKRGFDSHFGCYAGRGDFWDHLSEAGTFLGLDLRDGEKPVMNEWGNYTTDMFTDVAISRIMDHDANHPLFLLVSHLAVHSANSKAPLQAPDEEQKIFEDVEHPQRKMYLAMVASLDKSVGRIYNALKDAGILENTIFMFTTDNGGASNGFDSNHASNYPFRGIKTSLFEGGIRAASFINSPLLKKKRRVSKELLHITDWHATILALAGGQSDEASDGKDAWLHLSENKRSPRKELLLNIDDMVYQNSGLRVGKWKLVFQEPDEWTEWFNPPNYDRDEYDSLSRNPKVKRTSMIRCGKKPAEAPDCTNGCLFNMRQDPCEYKDLSQVNTEIFEELKTKLENYKKEMIPPRYKHDEDPNANPRNHGGVWSPWIDVEGEPVEHRPLPPEHKLPGQEEPKQGEQQPEPSSPGEEEPKQGEEQPAATNGAAPPVQEPHVQQPTPPQQALSQEAMKEKLMIPTTMSMSRSYGYEEPSRDSDFTDDYDGPEFIGPKEDSSMKTDQVMTSFDTIDDTDYDKIGKFFVLDAADGDATEI